MSEANTEDKKTCQTKEHPKDSLNKNGSETTDMKDPGSDVQTLKEKIEARRLRFELGVSELLNTEQALDVIRL